jgi:hypothetical protein
MIVRSFAVRGAGGTMPREGYLTARVFEFLGVIPRPDGFAILTICDEEARAGQGVLLPVGAAPVVAPGAKRWDFFIRVDNEPPPELARFLGGVALGEGVIFVFVAAHDLVEMG